MIGVDLVYFGIIMMLVFGIGIIMLLVGIVFFVGLVVGKICMEDIVKIMWFFYLVFILCLILVIYIL